MTDVTSALRQFADPLPIAKNRFGIDHRTRRSHARHRRGGVREEVIWAQAVIFPSRLFVLGPRFSKIQLSLSQAASSAVTGQRSQALWNRIRQHPVGGPFRCVRWLPRAVRLRSLLQCQRGRLVENGLHQPLSRRRRFRHRGCRSVGQFRDRCRESEFCARPGLASDRLRQLLLRRRPG